MSIAVGERETYERAWAIPNYAKYSPGEVFAPMFVEMVGDKGKSRFRSTTVLDAGCGSGKGAIALKLAGFSVSLCDITPEGLTPDAQDFRFDQVVLWRDLKAQGVREHDWVYCCDVLEHIPPTFTMLVVSRLLDVAKHGVFLSIALAPDQAGAWIGKPLHQSLQPYTAWRDQLREIGRLTESRDLINTSVYLLEK